MNLSSLSLSHETSARLYNFLLFLTFFSPEKESNSKQRKEEPSECCKGMIKLEEKEEFQRWFIVSRKIKTSNQLPPGREGMEKEKSCWQSQVLFCSFFLSTGKLDYVNCIGFRGAFSQTAWIFKCKRCLRCTKYAVRMCIQILSERKIRIFLETDRRSIICHRPRWNCSTPLFRSRERFKLVFFTIRNQWNGGKGEKEEDRIGDSQVIHSSN